VTYFTLIYRQMPHDVGHIKIIASLYISQYSIPIIKLTRILFITDCAVAPALVKGDWACQREKANFDPFLQNRHPLIDRSLNNLS